MATYPSGEALANDLLGIAAGTGLYPDFSNDARIPSLWKDFWGEICDVNSSIRSNVLNEFDACMRGLLDRFSTEGFNPGDYASSADFWSTLPGRLRAMAAVKVKSKMKPVMAAYTMDLEPKWYKYESLAYVGADVQRPNVYRPWPIFIELPSSESGISVLYDDFTEIKSLTESQAPGNLTTITLKTAGKQIPKNILIFAEGTWCDVTMGSETLYSPSSELITLNCSGRTTTDDIVITWNRG